MCHGVFNRLAIRVIANGALDLGRIDVFAARDDHVLDAVLNVEVAVLVDDRVVAVGLVGDRDDPAGVDRLRRDALEGALVVAHRISSSSA